MLIDTFTLVYTTDSVSLPITETVLLPILNNRTAIKKLHLTSLSVVWNDIGTAFIGYANMNIICRDLCQHSDGIIATVSPFNKSIGFVDICDSINLKMDSWFHNLKNINNEVTLTLQQNDPNVIYEFQGTIALTFEAYD
jgi:hypothetical protein